MRSAGAYHQHRKKAQGRDFQLLGFGAARIIDGEAVACDDNGVASFDLVAMTA